MPVRVAKRKGLYRIVEHSGRIAKTGKGHAHDGGGHASKAMAERQMRAMNSKMHGK